MLRLDFLLTGLVTICTILKLPYTVAIYGDHVVDATEGEFTFVVSLKFKGESPNIPPQNLIFCTGTLISYRHVLTAAHCFADKNPNEVEVLAGSVSLTKGEAYPIKSWITYVQWKSKKDNLPTLHDIAIIVLNQTLNNQNVKVAELLLSVPCNRPGARVKIAGWGFGNDTVLQLTLKTASLKLLSPHECQLKAFELGVLNYVAQQDVCTWADPYVLTGCGGSGGPLLNVQNKLIGVNVANCPEKKQPWVSNELWNSQRTIIHAGIYYYKEFIMHVTKTT